MKSSHKVGGQLDSFSALRVRRGIVLEVNDLVNPRRFSYLQFVLRMNRFCC